MGNNDCVFCKIIKGDIPSSVIQENDKILVIKDLHPKASIHYLIMPKKHLKDMSEVEEEDRDLAWEMFKVVKSLAKDLKEPKAFNLLSNNGRSSGQCVFHLHWHFLSGENVLVGKF